MTEQTDTGSSISGEMPPLEPAPSTTVSDASLDKFARTFEASARRWEVIVYPSLLAFIVLAAYGFYLIYSMTSDVHRVTGQMDLIINSVVIVSDNMVRVTDNMTLMAMNMNKMTVSLGTMTEEVAQIRGRFGEGIDIASRIDQKISAMLPIAHRMQIDADVMTHRMQSVTGPMNFMTRMFPMGN